MTEVLRFAKYEASGNDFVIVDEIEGPAPAVDAEAVCDRWTGVGADGLIRVTRGIAAPFRFDLTNADGSPELTKGTEATKGSCGSAIRTSAIALRAGTGSPPSPA